jgi:hypothetical protein
LPFKSTLDCCSGLIASGLCRAPGHAIAASDNSVAQIGRDAISVHAISDNLGSDENDQFCALNRAVVLRKQLTDARDFIQARDSVASAVLRLTDQSSQQNGLSAGNGNRACHPTL